MLQWRDLYDQSSDSHDAIKLVFGHDKQQLGKKLKGEHQRCLVCSYKTSIREGLKLKVEGCTDARCKQYGLLQ